jgi:carbamoyl-phosphate synthase large subunit
VGSSLGVSIFKALRQSSLQPRIVGTDADPLSVGLFRADVGYTLPRVDVDEAGYFERLEQICRTEAVSMVCFGSEIEMLRLAPHIDEVEGHTGARLILNPPRYVDAFMDKWTTVRLMREKDLPAPDTVLAADVDDVAAFLARHPFPLIMKPRHGAGSKNLFVVRTTEELQFFSGYVPDPVLQEFLLPHDEEYTVGLYKSRRDGYRGQIVLRRTIGAGLTYKAEVVRDEEIESVCRQVAESFDVWGPINLQLRKTAAGVRIFEINLRFSSSAVMRARFGFNEPEMCLRDVVLGEPIAPPDVRPGYALRYWDEIYLEPGEYQTDPMKPHVFEQRGKRVDAF